MFGTLGVKQRLGYDSAEVGGRHAEWAVGPDKTSDEYHRRQGGRLRSRARDLARNDLLAPTITRSLSINGYGVVPHADTGDPVLDKDIDLLWQEWSRQASTGTYHTADGLQYLMLREFLTSGAALIRGRARRDSDGLTVPLQLELLAADHLVTNLDRDLPDGSRIIQGVEVDALQRISAYWLWRERPGNGRPQSEYVRVPEPALCHLYSAEEVGQLRGVPWLSASMAAIRDLQLLSDAVRTRAVGESSFMGVVTTPEGEEGLTVSGQNPNDQDADGNVVESFQPGMWTYLRQGQDVTFHSPSGTSFDSTRKTEMMQVAAAAGVTAPAITGDYSNTNWTSFKAGAVENRALIRWMQQELLIPLVMRRVWTWWVDAGIAVGLLPESVRARKRTIKGGGSYIQGYPCRWELPPFAEIDRGAEAKATAFSIRNGLTTLEWELEKAGHDMSSFIASHARTTAELTANGIVLDCIPSQTTSSGQVQQAAPAAPDPDRHSQP